jgi:SAM-dependent methyltransferase
MILDVGCGEHKRGDIGVDKRRLPGVDIIVDIDKTGLPFHNSSFDMVVSHHVIEHLQNPEYLIKEIFRVSKGRVKIVCPHRFGQYAKITSDHIQFYNKKWFTQLAKKLGVNVRVRTTFEPLIYFGVCGLLMRPSELIVEYIKTMTEKDETTRLVFFTQEVKELIRIQRGH